MTRDHYQKVHAATHGGSGAAVEVGGLAQGLRAVHALQGVGGALGHAGFDNEMSLGRAKAQIGFIILAFGIGRRK